MAIPVWTPREPLTSSDVNNWLVPNAVTKAADESVTSSTTLQNDDVLVLPVVANAAYIMQCTLDYEGGTLNASDLKVAWAFPAGTTIFFGVAAYLHTDGTIHGAASIIGSTSFTVGTAGAGNHRTLSMSGSLITVGTPGNLQLQWAQSTSSGTATIVHKNSMLTLQRTS